MNFAGNTWTNNRVGYFKDGYVYGVNTDADAYMTNADGTITCGDTTPRVVMWGSTLIASMPQEN